MCFPHGQPMCLWTIAILGRAILAFLTWTTLMDELKLVKFLVHRQLVFSKSIFFLIFYLFL